MVRLLQYYFRMCEISDVFVVAATPQAPRKALRLGSRCIKSCTSSFIKSA